MSTTYEFVLPDDSVAVIDTRVEITIVPARPGLFVIDLLPLPGGGFNRAKFLKTPMLAWQVGGSDASWGRPVVSGATVTDGWSVLLPNGFLALDEYQSLKFSDPIRVQAWINSEIDWMKVAHRYIDPEGMKGFSTPREAILCYGAPIAKAMVTMMSWRTDDWIGTPEELLADLSAFRLRRGPQLPTSPFVVATSAIALAKEMADTGVIVERIDDGRIRMGRRATPEQSFSIASANSH